MVHRMAARYGPRITVPDGRVFIGRPPHCLGTRGEAPYIAALARQVNGAAEVRLPCGRADVATDTHVFEVEPIRSWRVGAQQAYAYAGMTGLRPAIAVFGGDDWLRDDWLRLYLTIRNRMPGLELWRWRGTRWQHVRSRSVI